MPARHGIVIAAFPLFATLCSGGCAGIKGFLATDSGPSPVGWSTVDTQHVHAGEEVEFSFVIARGKNAKAPIDPAGIADYCVASIDGVRREAVLDNQGHFRFSHRVGDRAHGATLSVHVAAYRQDMQRDAMMVGDEWVLNENPTDRPDRIIATDQVQLIVYRSEIDFPVRHPQDAPLDMQQGRLVIIRRDGSISTIQADQSGFDAFDVTGPSADGTYRVLYHPRADQLNKNGSTDVRFIVPTRGGDDFTFEAFLATP